MEGPILKLCLMSTNKTNFSLVCYLFKSRSKQNGQAPILLRININGQKTVIQLKRTVDPSQWDQKRGCVIGRSADAKVFNDYIDSIKLRARQKYNELLLSHDQVTPGMLKDAILGINSAKPKMIIEVWQEHLEGMIKLIGKETTKATCQKYATAKNHLQNFLKKRYKVSDISVKSIDHHMITQFDLYLKTDAGCAINTTTKFLQNYHYSLNKTNRGYEFHRLHSLGGYTLPNLVASVYGLYWASIYDHRNFTRIESYAKKAGYITGLTSDMCSVGEVEANCK